MTFGDVLVVCYRDDVGEVGECVVVEPTGGSVDVQKLSYNSNQQFRPRRSSNDFVQKSPNNISVPSDYEKQVIVDSTQQFRFRRSANDSVQKSLEQSFGSVEVHK